MLLYVEDDPHTSHLFKLAVKDFASAVRVEVVEDQAGALRFLHDQDTHEGRTLPALVVLDLNLCGASGFSVLEEIRQTRSLEHLAAVIFSTSRLPKDQDRARQMGVEFLHKPVELEEFWQIVHRICAMARPQTELGSRK